jgi:hypothetical protein
MGQEEGVGNVISRLRLYALIAAAFFLGILGMRAFWIDEGVEKERAQRDEDRLDAMRKAKEVRDEVESDPYLADRATRWLRDDEQR